MTTSSLKAQFEQRSKLAPSHSVSSSGAARKFTGASDKCSVCSKTVYPMEKISADGVIFHKGCFTCKHCNCGLKLGTYAALDSQFYCKPHFKQLFALKGNYNEGFGKQKLTSEWTNKSGDSNDSSNSRPNEVHSPDNGSISRAHDSPSTDRPEASGKNVTSRWNPQNGKSQGASDETTKPSAGTTSGLKARFENMSRNEPKETATVTRTTSGGGNKGRFGTKDDQNKCGSCSKVVYMTERLVVDTLLFHKKCFTCSHCNCPLAVGKYTLNNGKMYCIPHFKQLFALKGNYSEGFAEGLGKRAPDSNESTKTHISKPAPEPDIESSHEEEPTPEPEIESTHQEEPDEEPKNRSESSDSEEEHQEQREEHHHSDEDRVSDGENQNDSVEESPSNADSREDSDDE